MKNPTSECRKRDFRLFAATRGRPPMRGVILRKRFRFEPFEKFPERDSVVGAQVGKRRDRDVPASGFDPADIDVGVGEDLLLGEVARMARSRSCATTPRTTGSLYRSFFRRMVQRYVKFGNFRSPVAASFAALQKVRSAPPVTGLLLPAVRRLLFAVCCSPPTLRPPPQSVARCLLFAACCPWFVACCLCLLFALRCLLLSAHPLLTSACHSLLSARRLPPATAARHHSSPPANSRRAGRFLSGKPRFCPDMR